MLKVAAAIVSGVVIALAIVFATDALFHSLSSTAANMPTDTHDRLAMETYVAAQPAAVLAALLAGWAFAAGVGSVVASYLAGRGEWPGWVVGCLFLMATAANFLVIPHPPWMVAAGILTVALAGWAGSRAGGSRVRAAD